MVIIELRLDKYFIVGAISPFRTREMTGGIIDKGVLEYDTKTSNVDENTDEIPVWLSPRDDLTRARIVFATYWPEVRSEGVVD